MCKIDKNIARVIADVAVLFEFSSDELINDDVAVGALEQMAYNLNLLDRESKDMLKEAFSEISCEYDNEKCEFVRELCDSFGLFDEYGKD